jgi:hypothetical protein
VSVSVNRYGSHSRKIDEIAKQLKAAHVRYNVLENYEWFDYGDLHKRNFSRETLERSFHACASAQCKTLLGGSVYACPRSAHMVRLGLLDDERALRVSDEPDFAERLCAFYDLPSIEACDYCNPPWARDAIVPGEQSSARKIAQAQRNSIPQSDRVHPKDKEKRE